jgi:hypothetical protein
MNALAPVKGNLYRSVTGDLHDAIPGLQDLDQHYSDMRSAVDTIRGRAANFAVTRPPNFWQQLPPQVRRGIWLALGGAAGTAGFHGAGELYKLIFGGE